ncbi:MAG: DUF2653 family protein [Sporolactobacillus sp.]
MEEIIISEQEIINALCLFLAKRKEVSPNDVKVELVYDDDYGFSAETYARGRKQILVEATIIEAVRYWLETEMQADPVAASLRLELDDEQGIIIHYQT